MMEKWMIWKLTCVSSLTGFARGPFLCCCSFYSQLYERIKIAKEGIVFANVEVKNRLVGATAGKARKGRAGDRGDGKVAGPTGIQVNLRITARALWIEEGRLISEMNRFVKTRLRELMPLVQVFLDVDDLKTGAGAEYIDKSAMVLCHCTAKYLKSRACAREIFTSLRL